jgi:hypothetical protein
LSLVARHVAGGQRLKAAVICALGGIAKAMP